uniref:Uncharacterized protein n=1 Tax=Parascaris univalens TaxID=6257 RepID=A0A915AZQ9_PARUN
MERSPQSSEELSEEMIIDQMLRLLREYSRCQPLEMRSYPQLVVPRCVIERSTSIPNLLHRRELYGKSIALRRTRAWKRLRDLEMPTTVTVRNVTFDLLKDGVFLGMSNESRYVVGMLYGPVSHGYGGLNANAVLVIMSLSPCRLTPAFIAVLNSAYFYELYATFPRDSSFISVISFTENVIGHELTSNEPMTTLVALDFVLFQNALHLSMKTSVVLSSRWRHRLCRTLLRSFDHGAILNAGTMLIGVIFTKCKPPMDNVGRRRISSFQVMQVDEAQSSEWAGVVLQEITISDARTAFTSTDNRYYALLPSSSEHFPSASHGLDQSLFFTEVVMDVEKLLITQMPNVVKAFLPGGCYVGLVDYEIDVVGCDGYMVYVIVSVVVEAKSPGASGMNRPFVGVVHVEWNTYDGKQHYRSLRPLWAINWASAKQPRKWYPFRPRQSQGLDERVLSNEAFIAGKSLQTLMSPLAGIALYK